MKIFIQGRKDGYNTLYPKPTPAEFFQFASDIQRIDAQNNSHYYGKSLYSIAFNGNGCIFTKYIIGYDTLRSNIGNIGISVFIPNNQKMLGADVKTLLDELINIYTTNYCPDFKINNQKQEDWLLFQSAADNYEKNDKLKTISSDENFQYGNRDAAYIICNNIDEIEKYLDAPYQAEYKEYKQILFVDNQSRLLLEVIKHDHDTKANLSDIIDLDNPSYKLREYHGQAKNSVSIEIRAEGRLRNNKDKIFRKDIVTIKYSKKYHIDIFEKGNISDPQIAKYLKIFDNSIDVEKNIELKPVAIPIEIRICNSKGESISDPIITCRNDYSKIEKQVSQNTIIFSGEEQTERWIISAKKDSFIGEVKIIPENESTLKLDSSEVKIIKLIVLDENGDLNPQINKNYAYTDDEIRSTQRTSRQIPNINNQQISYQNENNKLKEKNKSVLYFTLIALSIFSFIGAGFYFYDDIFGGQDESIVFQNNKTKVEELPKLNGREIERYVEGDSLILDTLHKYKTDWEMITPVIETVTYKDSNSTSQKQDSTEFKNWKKIDESLVRAINKRIAINEGDFGFFKDNNNKINFSEAQRTFKIAVSKIKQKDHEQLRNNLGDVSKLTLTQIADSINKYIEASNEKNSNVEEDNSQTKKSSPKSDNKKSEIKKSAQIPEKTISPEEQEIIEYLKGSELKIDNLNGYKKKATSDKLKKSIVLALDFWKLDGSTTNQKKTYYSFKKNVENDPNFINSELLKFLKGINTNTKYPLQVSGAGKTKTLGKFIEQSK